MELELGGLLTDRKSEVSGEARAFVLLETARLRAEMLSALYGDNDQLRAIHREIGTAGYVTCETFSAELRRDCVAMAVSRMSEDQRTHAREGHPHITRASQPIDIGRALATMFSETIAASDALANELADREVDDEHRDRLHLVHAHVMSACELLDERLTVLELEGAGPAEL